MMKHILYILFFVISLGASQKPLQNVSLRLQWLDQFQFAGYYMAKEKGFYESEGFDVEIKRFSGDIDIIDDVLNGSSTYGIGRSGLIWHYTQGRDISLISAAFQSSPFTLMALESSGIHDIKEFAGKTVMLTQDLVDTADIYAMVNINMSNRGTLKHKKHSFDLDDLINKNVDLYAAYTTNEPYILEQKGIQYRLFSPKDIGLDFYSDILFTSGQNARKDPYGVEKFKRASLKGWAYAFNNMEETVDIIYRKYNGSNKTKEALMFEARELKKLAFWKDCPLGAIEKNKIERILDVYRVMGLADSNVDIDDLIFTPQNKLLDQAQQRYLEQKKEVRICLDTSLPPFGVQEGGELKGVAADILDLANKNIKIPYKLVETHGWEESLQNIKNKKCDIVHMTSNLPLQDGIKPASPYHYEDLVIVTEKGENYIVDIYSVMDKEFAVNKNSLLAASLKERYPGIKLGLADSLQEGFDAVEKGKYYGYIENFVIAAYALKNGPNSNLKIAGGLDHRAGLCFGVRDDEEMLFGIFERVSKNIKDSDVHKIFSEWVSVNYVQNVSFKYLKESLFLVSFILFILFYRHYILKKKNEELRIKVAEAVAEMQKKETYMLHKSRMVQMGEMISMIAHQWKQPLSIISSLNISMIMAIELERYDLDDKKQREEFLVFLDEKLKKSGMHIQNLSQIISDFGDYYRPNKHMELTTLNDAVLKSYQLLEESLASKNIEMCLELTSKNMVNIFKNEFIQVIINIVNNAKEQFIQNNIKDAQITIKSYDVGDIAVLEISDNALGIPEDIIDNIFDPYFSTKFDKNGTGLGLHMSKSIIKQHYKGDIYAKNIDGGAMFRIEIGAHKENG